MEQTENNIPKIDLITLFFDFMNALKNIWLPGMIIVVICTGLIGYKTHKSYYPLYETSASLTIKVINPLYSSINEYNVQTAEQMENTFPYILSSDALREKVETYLGASDLPTVSADVIPETNVFILKCTSTDAQWSYDVLQAMLECYPQVAEYVVGTTKMVLLDEPVVPTEPVNSYSIVHSLTKGAVLGLIIWMAMAFILMLLKNTVHNEEELKKLLNFPCLGTVPATKVVGKDLVCPMITHENGKYGFGDTMRILTMYLEKEMIKQDKKVLLISSASPGEGKTTISANLALSLAEKGRKVVLVDCDLRNPSVAKVFQIDNKEGLADYLEGRLNVKEVMRKTEIENLFMIVGSESNESEAADLLSSEKLGKLIKALKNVCDYVILDTSPCALLADASEVAELAEGAVMVVRQDYASKQQILEGVQLLTDSGLPLLGSILNGVEGGRRYGYGYYGYGYGYGYGSYGYRKK